MLGLNDITIARLFREGRYDDLVDEVYSRKPEVVVLTIMPGTSGGGPSGKFQFTDVVQESFYSDPRFAETYDLGFRIAHYLVYSRN
jgi:hypothetical protein